MCEAGWKDAPHNVAIAKNSVPYFDGHERPRLSSIFSTYDWVSDDGYDNFNKWVAAAAKQAGR